MPRDTIIVNLTADRPEIKFVNYYVPLLVYKSNNIKLGSANEKSKVIHNLTSYNAVDILNKLQKGAGNDDDFREEIAYLTSAIVASLSGGSGSLGTVNLIIYKETNDAVEVLKELRNKLNLFVAFINPFVKNEQTGGDGLTIYKDDYPKMQTTEHFYVFATKETEIKEIFKNKSDGKDKAIVFYSPKKQHIHLRFLAKYLGEASRFHATNPYGIDLKGQSVLMKNDIISKLVDANINFHTLLNENGFDGQTAIKEGVTLDGTDIDEVFSYAYIKIECIKTLIKTWYNNGRRNSKLSRTKRLTTSLTFASKDNAYTSNIDGLLNDLIDKEVLYSYKNLRLEIQPIDKTLQLKMSVEILYNYSVNSVIMYIDSEDISTHIRSLK